MIKNRMKKCFKKFLSILLCLIFVVPVFSSVGCNDGGGAMGDNIKLWSVPSTEKIILNQQPLDSVDSTMNIIMAKKYAARLAKYSCLASAR